MNDDETNPTYSVFVLATPLRWNMLTSKYLSQAIGLTNFLLKVSHQSQNMMKFWVTSKTPPNKCYGNLCDSMSTVY